ncbi:hypothetical protein PLESTF_001248700 [Pleodorina starrii]|nr:hypothetical protein PLESTF_001248700 [Pleodorina starrii]
MDDPLRAKASSDPLDELGGLVGQTLNIFDGHGQAAAAKSSEPALDAFGSMRRVTSGIENVIAQSMDLDLLGSSTTAQVAPGANLVGNTFGFEADDIPLVGDDEQLEHTLAGEQGQLAASNSSQAEPRRVEDRSDPGPSGYRLVADGASTSNGEVMPAEPIDVGEAAPIRVWIREPERMEGTNKLGIRTTYLTYLVRTESQLPALRTDGSEVRRRFSEFDALHKLMKLQYRGYIIPPLPEKSFIEAKLAHDDFLRLRRADLQAFLRGIAQHPALRESEALKLFLLQPGELQYNPAWIALLHSVGGPLEFSDGGAVSLMSPGGGSAASKAVAGLNSLVTWVRNSVTTTRRELDEDEQQLRHAKELMRDLERLLQLACEAARVMCSHMDSLGSDLYELGRNMGMLSKWEETLRAHSGSYTEAGFSASKRAADCKQLSYASARQHTLWKTASVKTAASLVALHDYYIVIPEAVAALEERERCLDQIHALEAELMARHADLNKTGGKGAAANRDRRGYTLTNTVDRLEEQLKACRDSYVLIKRRNMEELRRLHLTREKDFHDMMANFSALQAQIMQASADMWRTTARQFRGEPVSAGTDDDAQTDE